LSTKIRGTLKTFTTSPSLPNYNSRIYFFKNNFLEKSYTVYMRGQRFFSRDDNAAAILREEQLEQCCGSGSGIRCLFDPWIRDPE
jgi:hypothetical protein